MPINDDPYDFSALSVGDLVRRLESTRRTHDRLEVVMELGGRAERNEDAYTALLAVASTDKSPQVRAMALEEIAKSRRFTPEAINTAIRTLESEENSAAKLAAVELFAVHFVEQSGLERALPALLAV